MSNRHFQNMELNFHQNYHMPDLNRQHLLYDESKYNGNRHFQASEAIHYNQPCQEG